MFVEADSSKVSKVSILPYHRALTRIELQKFDTCQKARKKARKNESTKVI